MSSNPKSEQTLPVVLIEDMPFSVIDERSCVRYIMDRLAEGTGGWIITANADHLRRFVNDLSYRALVNSADLVVADGMPLIWLSRLQGHALPERVAGSTIVHTIARCAAGEGRSLFLLGGDPGIAEQAAGALQTRYPGLKIAGTYCPPYGFDQDDREVDQVRQTVVASKPDIIYVALGSPKQERLIHHLREDCPGAWWMGVGISLSFITGHVRRAPVWIQKIGLEWVHRLIQEPRRLAKRYLMEDLPFVVRLLVKSAFQRCRVRPSRSREGVTGDQPFEH